MEEKKGEGRGVSGAPKTVATGGLTTGEGGGVPNEGALLAR